jgi:hypothetical protein
LVGVYYGRHAILGGDEIASQLIEASLNKQPDRVHCENLFIFVNIGMEKLARHSQKCETVLDQVTCLDFMQVEI